MTCIVGVLDKKDDCVYIGADSLVSFAYSKFLMKNKKVFKAKDNKNILMAGCGHVTLLNSLSVTENLIDELTGLKNEVNIEHIIKHTVPKMFETASKYNCCEIENGIKVLSHSLIFAYKNQLYLIDCNGGVIEPFDDYIASGSGIEYALGVLSQNQDNLTVDRIKEALEAAEKHGSGIERPFYIMNTKDDEVVEIL